ncbi:MAG: hypothetical protein J6T91_01795 [Alphaproteobacteria bacterium]|nr:hypothetical protein [Alphaproteobacteria bacterium]
MRREVFFTILLYSSTNIFGMSNEPSGKLYHRPKVESSALMVEKSGDPIPSSSNSKPNVNSRKRKTIEVIEIDDDEPNKKICVSRDTFTYIGENFPIEPKDRYEIYSQYHYELVKNHMIGFSTPTTVLVYPKGNPRIWSDIREIHYSHDVSSQHLVNPKVSLFRNRNNTCNILLNGVNVIQGTNERHIVTQNNSFATYEVLKSLGSFLDNISRRIYVDITGLYIVTEENNSIQDIITRYKKKGMLEFKNPSFVVKISASTGDITVGNTPITADNFIEKSCEEAPLAYTNAIFRKFKNIPYPHNIDGLSGCAAGYRSSSHGAFVYSAYYKEAVEEFVQKEISAAQNIK